MDIFGRKLKKFTKLLSLKYVILQYVLRLLKMNVWIPIITCDNPNKIIPCTFTLDVQIEFIFYGYCIAGIIHSG